MPKLIFPPAGFLYNFHIFLIFVAHSFQGGPEVVNHFIAWMTAIGDGGNTVSYHRGKTIYPKSRIIMSAPFSLAGGVGTRYQLKRRAAVYIISMFLLL